MAESNENKGQTQASATESTDSKAAKKSGSTEGEIKALRDDAGLNQLPGHQANLAAWESSPAGKEFKKGEKDRETAEKEAAKVQAESAKKQDKVVQQYVEAAK